MRTETLYEVSYTEPLKRLIHIAVTFFCEGKKELEFHLPAWRPGRYELGNFAKNIISLEVLSADGTVRECKKVNKDSWRVKLLNDSNITIRYTYYTPELTAGSCWIDERQLYINGSNCFVYTQDSLNNSCKLTLNIPRDFVVASSIKKDGNRLLCKDFHELVDSPLIASPHLQRNFFVLDGVEVNLWFTGGISIPWSKLISDFFIFVAEHFALFGEYPGTEFHFLFQDLPYTYRHGVEHLHSTVIAMGPNSTLMEGEAYNDMLAISCHEFFHVYNIKMIRPVEMLPYNYAAENYSRLGYVYEGVTTYYGDYLLYRSGVFSEEEYFKLIEEALDIHFYNGGRLNLSVADSSFDTWLDGYVMGAPNRKVSIYNEGALCALMSDLLIRKHSGNQRSLDDVMRRLYQDYAKKGKGYNESDYRKLCEEAAGKPLPGLFDDLINGRKDYMPLLKECASFIGCEISEKPSSLAFEARLGFRIMEDGSYKVRSVAKGSNAEEKLSVGFKICEINGTELKGKTLKEISLLVEDENTLVVEDLMQQKRTVSLTSSSEAYYKAYRFSKAASTGKEQRQLFEGWSKKKFIVQSS